MNTCTKCGTDIIPHSVFCTECGARVEVSQPDEQHSSVPPYQAPSQSFEPPPQPYQSTQQYYQPQSQPQAYPTQYGQQSQTPPYQFPYPQQKTVREPGRRMIFVVSILLTVFGAMYVLSSLVSLFLTPFFGLMYPNNIVETLIIGIFLGALYSVLTLSFGIGGLVMTKNPNRANTLMIFGVVLLIMNFISSIWGFILTAEITEFFDSYMFGSYHDEFAEILARTVVFSSVTGIVIGFIFYSVLPILLIIGAHIRKKNA